MPPLFLRLSPNNRYSLSALAGILAGDPSLACWSPMVFEHPHAPDGPLGYRGNNPVIAYSFMSTELDQVAAEIQQLRRSHPQAVLIAGGAHPSGDPQSTLGMGFDIAFVGEAEISWPKLLTQLEKKTPLSALPRIIHGTMPDALDAYASFHAPTLGVTPLELSRGCPYGCTFCQTAYIFGRRVRHRSIAALKVGFEAMVAAQRHFLRFIAPNAFGYLADAGKPNVPALETLLRTARESGIRDIYLGTFPGEVRPEYCTDEVLSLVKTYCKNRRIVVGAQTGVPRLNRLLKRGHTVEHVRQACERIARRGLMPYVDVIFGIPQETPDDARATLQLAQQLVRHFHARIHAHHFIPLPGTPLADATATPLPPAIREEILLMEQHGVLDGDWVKQEKAARDVPQMIRRWRLRGYGASVT